MRGAETHILQETRGLEPSRVGVGGHLVRVPLWGLPSPSLRETFLLAQIPASGKKPTRAGSSEEPGPAPPTGSRPKSAGLSQAASEPWGPTPPAPPNLLEELKATGAENQLALVGCGEEKPRQLPPNWPSKPGEASKCRNELNKLFSPLRGGVPAPGLHPSHTLAAAIYKI